MVYAHRSPALAGELTSPLTAQLVAAIGARWNGGADFPAIADDVVDVVAEHIRRTGIRGPMDPRLATAIADAIAERVALDDVPRHEPGQRTLADALRECAPAADGTCAACAAAQQSGDLGWCACGATWGYR